MKKSISKALAQYFFPMQKDTTIYSSTYTVLSACIFITVSTPDPAPRGAFRDRAPQITACAPPSEDRAPKQATGVHFGACTPQNTACAPLSVNQVSFQDGKHE